MADNSQLSQMSTTKPKSKSGKSRPAAGGFAPKSATPPQAKALRLAEAYIRSMHSASSRKEPPDRWNGFTMNAEHGHIGLGPQQVRAHATASTALQDAYARTDDLSPSEIAKELERVMWKAVDLVGQSASPLDKRLEQALNDLHIALVRPVAEFECWVLVSGLDVGRGVRMGNVALRRFGRRHKRVLSQQSGLLRDHVLRAEDLAKDRVVATVHVLARGRDGARALARNAVRRALDVINFFRPAQPFQQGWAYLPEEAASIKTFSVVRATSERHAGIEYSIKGPFPNLKPRELRPGDASLWRSASALLRAANPGNVAELVSTAMQWAGRAEVATTREAAFLSYAIALETLLLPIHGSELNYRLAQRTSRLLGRSKTERAEIVARTKRLYGTRSKIVHSGSFMVSTLELSEINALAVSAIVRALRRRSLWLESSKAWEAELERRAL